MQFFNISFYVWARFFLPTFAQFLNVGKNCEGNYKWCWPVLH